MRHRILPRPSVLAADAISGTVVFLVALPLCLGVALASGAPLFSGILAGIVGGIVVGSLSGSNTSVSGPAAGLTAIVAVQLKTLGSFEAFLLAVVIAGLIQIGLGIARAGFIAAFFPTSVIKGLLAAIGAILILKQIPHVLGHDADPEGEMAFFQPDQENTFSELSRLLENLHPGAALIGILSILVLVLWERSPRLKKSIVPAPLIVVVFGIAADQFFQSLGGRWPIEAGHSVQVPVAETLAGFVNFLTLPDFNQWANPAIYSAAITLAIVASLETLLNLEATDKLDRRQRTSPPSRELLAQGVANSLGGLIGAIPVTSVIVRSSVNINSGAKTKLSAIFHGVLLLVCVVALPAYLNLIPLSCLAAILLVTGAKLASPALLKQMWSEGRYQFIPFAVTLVAIVLTDLLIGIGIGMAVSLAFILNSNLRRPLRRTLEKHIGGEVLHIELANQVSFLNRAALDKALRGLPRGSHVLLDAKHTDYIDPDILSLIREFKERAAPVRGVQVSLRGFRNKYQLQDDIKFVDYSTRELQGQMTPTQVLRLLKDGNERFRSGHPLTRDLGRQLDATAKGQHPLAVVLSCIDSRSPMELIFDLGLGDIFSVRVAANVISRKALGSMEYACAVAGAKLVLVVGHTQCGAVTAAVELASLSVGAEEATGCQNLEPIVREIQSSFDVATASGLAAACAAEKAAYIDGVARENVRRSVRLITQKSTTIKRQVDEGRVVVVGAMYDISSGRIELLTEEAVGAALVSSQTDGLLRG